MQVSDRNKYDERHGGPFDRGSADSWYGRGINPHYYLGDTGVGPAITAPDMTKDQVAEYLAGYEWNEKFGGKKDWN